MVAIISAVDSKVAKGSRQRPELNPVGLDDIFLQCPICCEIFSLENGFQNLTFLLIYAKLTFNNIFGMYVFINGDHAIIL